MTGDFVLTMAVNAQNVQIGDIVTYRKMDESGKLTHSTVIHRIVEEQDGQYIFKGDNNDSYDAPVDPKQITFKVVWYKGKRGTHA